MSKKTKHYTPEFKFKVALESFIKGKVKEIARQYHVHPNQLSSWRNAFQKNGYLIFSKDDNFTAIFYSGKKIYLCVHMDYSGKYIFGRNLSESPDHKLILSSADKAIRCLKKFKISDFSKIIFHLDRGTVYTSENYVGFY